MKKIDLKNTKEYIALTIQGKPKKEAAKTVFGSSDTKAIKLIETSDEYKLLHNTMVQDHRSLLSSELAQLQIKKTRAYSSLLTKGEELLANASTLEDQISAQENQRRNLSVSLIEDAASWNSVDRNKTEPDLLEGIIIS